MASLMKNTFILIVAGIVLAGPYSVEHKDGFTEEHQNQGYFLGDKNSFGPTRMVDRIRGFLDKPASTVKYYTGFNPIPDRNGKDDPAGEGKDKETNFDKEPVDTSSEDVDFLNDPSSLDDVDEDYEDPDDNSYDSSDFGTELTGSTGGNSAASHGGSAGDPPSNATGNSVSSYGSSGGGSASNPYTRADSETADDAHAKESDVTDIDSTDHAAQDAHKGDDYSHNNESKDNGQNKGGIMSSYGLGSIPFLRKF